MANSNFVVHNGLTVGPLSVDAATGQLIARDIIPTDTLTYNLGSPTKQWHSVYVGPGSLYVNGQKVLQDNSGTIVVSADTDQNLSMQTLGSGDIILDPTGTGVVSLRGAIQVQAGNNIVSSDGNAVSFGSAVAVDVIGGKTTNTDLTLSALGTGHVKVDDSLIVTGDLTIQGTTSNLSVSTLSVQDNIIDISSETIGVPSANAGIRIVRGDEAAVQLRWNESSNKWQFTNDGSTYLDIVAASSAGDITVSGAATAGSVIAGNISVSATADAITSTGTLTLDPNPTGSGGLVVIQGNLQVTGTTTTVQSTTLDVTDLNVTVAKGAANAAAANGAGLTVDGAGATMLYTSTTDTFNFNKSVVANVTGNVTGNLTGNSAGTHTGAVVGNASTATALATPRAINGTNFDGSAAITVTAAAGTLTGATLNSGVTASSLTSVGTLSGVTVSSTIAANANNTINIGAAGTTFATVYATTFSGVSTTAKYADLAENYQADAAYAPGTVVHFGGEFEVTACDVDGCTSVAGVVSTDPAHLMNSGLAGDNVVALALQGRVPCQVTGVVKKGDLMVSAGNGRARAEANPKVGSVIGKALANSEGDAVIEVVVGIR